MDYGSFSSIRCHHKIGRASTDTLQCRPISATCEQILMKFYGRSRGAKDQTLRFLWQSVQDPDTDLGRNCLTN